MAFVKRYEAVRLVEFKPEVFSFQDEVSFIIVCKDREDDGFVGLGDIGNRQAVLISAERNLVVCGEVAGRERVFRFLQPEINVQHPLFSRTERSRVISEGDFRRTLRGYFKPVHRALLHRLSVGEQFPVKAVCRKVTEEILIVYGYGGLGKVGRRSPDGLVDVAHFVCVRVRFPVGTDESVVAEILVLVHIISVEVSGIAVEHFALCIELSRGLVHEVPDESALEGRIFAHEVPVFLEAALGVAHRVGVFAQNQRLAGIVAAIFLAGVVAVVHRTIYVGVFVVSGSFILDRP